MLDHPPFSQPHHMDASILLQFAHSHSAPSPSVPLHYNNFGDRVADRPHLTPSSSFVRSSAPRSMNTPQQQQPQQQQSFQNFALPSFRSPFPISAAASASSSFLHDTGSPYDLPDPDAHNSTATAQAFHSEQQYAQQWSQVVESQAQQYADSYASSSYDLAPSSPPHADGPMLHQSARDSEHIEPYSSLYLPSYPDQLQNHPGSDGHSPLAYSTAHYQAQQQHPLSAYTYGAPEHSPEVPHLSPYMLGGSPQHLAFDYAPPSDSDLPQFVHPSQVSPGVSPASPYVQLAPDACDPRFLASAPAHHPVHGGSSNTHHHHYGHGHGQGSDSASASGAGSPPPRASRKRQRSSSLASSSGDEYRGSSGESEPADGDEDEDEDYAPRAARRSRHGDYAPAISPATSVGSSATSAGGHLGGAGIGGAGGGRRLAPPVPVPNLTKKSRGRRVPTAQQVVTEGSVQKRMYMCKVGGCGKCFARGEHLKRHVRSIHTNEKPHKCPYPGCGKDFSRHDNLGQHMRVHKGFQMPKGSLL
ncbi:uncharacterized protein BXZ73DRAFT_106533 [Epithele typhae]|uniref:uncharacterized protein n=1 Tax=Epithele typhae TaxID=378194 RepID=UPI002007B314|nr:uncharacterized protein BXZ73DRAFT_106533 [Epithele typhae]KAH9914634.1 hypothetical protein BXZ73DRAFT_106533 [Epithele typhae]